MSKTALILGAGFSGCTLAHLLATKGWDCTVVEKDHAIGGGCRTLFYGGHPYTNGPRVYYGYSERVYQWINRFIEMRPLDFELLSYVESEHRFFSYPIHEDDIPLMSKSRQIQAELQARDLTKKPADFEEYWISRVGRTLYDMFVNSYSRKMWRIESNKQLDTFSWSAKDNPINSGSRIAYKGSYLAYPTGYTGYNPYFDKTIAGATLILNQSPIAIDFDRRAVTLGDGTVLTADVLISSIPIDEFCGFSRGELPYAGRDFIPFVLPIKRVSPGNVRFFHYTQNEPYTRIVEYKALTDYQAEDTLLVMELPSANGKLYPYMLKKHIDTAKRYQEDLPENVFSTGRLGTYRYSTIEQTIAQAFTVFRNITGQRVDNIDEEFYEIGDLSLIKDRK
ncbi:MAG: UDP-galactopyranose mutase [Azospirillaceae bacterium]|nr:UDP-galactopyranose mutase [Azospirillaceae bacterium]